MILVLPTYLPMSADWRGLLGDSANGNILHIAATISSTAVAALSATDGQPRDRGVGEPQAVGRGARIDGQRDSMGTTYILGPARNN